MRAGEHPAARSMLQATLAVFALSALVKLLGFVTDLSLAAFFGAGPETDAYLVAATIPLQLWLPVASTVALAFLPAFSVYVAREGRDEAWRTFSGVVTLLAVGTAAATLAGLVWAPEMVGAMAPGLDPQTLALAVSLARIMLSALVLLSLYFVVGAALNAHRRFAVAAGAPAALNLAIIGGILLLARRHGIAAAAAGWLLGAGLQLAMCVPSLLRCGARYAWRLDLGHPGLRQVGRLFLPLVVALLLGQASVLVERYLASWLAAGTISALAYASKLAQLPQMLVATAVATVIYPSLVSYSARQEDDRFRRTLGQALRAVVLVLLPAAVGLAVLSQPVVRMLLQRGAFDPRATQLTASALVFYAPGIVAAGAAGILVRGLYAVQDMWTPLRVGAFALAAHVVTAFALVQPMGHSGLALAFSVGSTVNAVGLYSVLRSRGLTEALPLAGLGLPLLAVGCMTLVSVGVARLTGGHPLGAAAAIAAGGVAYLGCLLGLGVADARSATLMLLASVRERTGAGDLPAPPPRGKGAPGDSH